MSAMDMDDEYVPNYDSSQMNTNYGRRKRRLRGSTNNGNSSNVINNNRNNRMNYDSMSEEEEYEPIDYTKYKKKSTTQIRAKRSFVVNDEQEIEHNQRPLKKRKTNPQNDAPKFEHFDNNDDQDIEMNDNPITSTSILNTLKKNKNYEKRATTKILPTKDKSKNGIKSKLNGSKKGTRKRKGKDKLDSFATQMLIAQKTTQNSIHSNVPLTNQEKQLRNHYKRIEKLQAKLKKKSKKKAISNTSILDQAMGSSMNTNTSSNIILEPGQEAPTQSQSNTSSGFTDDYMSGFCETFIKRTTQMTTMSAATTNSKKGIDVDDYFGSNTTNKPLSHQERMELNQKKALAQLKRSGDTEIGKIKKPTQVERRKIKRNKIAPKPMDHHVFTHNNNSMDNNKPIKQQQNKPKMESDALNDNGLDDLNADGDIDLNNDNNDSSNGNTADTSMDSSGLNSALGDSLQSFENQDADTTTLNLQKFELARKAAMDKTAAFDDEEHLENCNVYVGGLHPEVDQAMLRKFFQHCGDIKQIRLDWRKKGFGFIHYSTHEQAREAIEDMDGRIIMGQPIKCRWAKNKNKERERMERLQEERDKELARANGVVVPDDPNEELNKDVEIAPELDSINTNHPQQFSHRRPGVGNNGGNGNNNNGGGNEGSTTSIGFLSRGMGGRKSKSNSNNNNNNVGGPPALIKMKDGKKEDGIEDNDDEVEYW